MASGSVVRAFGQYLGEVLLLSNSPLNIVGVDVLDPMTELAGTGVVSVSEVCRDLTDAPGSHIGQGLTDSDHYGIALRRQRRVNSGVSQDDR